MNRDVQTSDHFTENTGLSSNSTQIPLDNTSWETLSGSTEIFCKLLKFGRVRGVVSVLGLPDSKSKDATEFVQLVQELINRDILVTIFSYGATEGGATHTIASDLFQHTGDGLAEFCDFIGIEPVLQIEGATDSPDIREFYTTLSLRAAVETTDLPTASVATGGSQQTESLGLVFTMEDGPVKTADRIDKYIHDKRVGVQWCDRCGGCFSPFS